MRHLKTITIAAMATSIITSLSAIQSCTTKAPDYSSEPFDSYPVKASSLDEMSYSKNGTSFNLWAPSAEAVRVHIYESGDVSRDFGGLTDAARSTSAEDGSYSDAIITQDLKKGKDGSWKGTVKKDLMDKFYTFQIKYKGEWLSETPGINAKAVGLNGRRAAVIDMTKTDPSGWAEDRRPDYGDYDDIILYETHHRDFSMDPDNGITNKGKFLAYTETGTKTKSGYSTGIDHLADLGITHLHILPSFDSDGNEAKDYYNWGYDPLNYNVPEGRYSTDASNPYARINEFKQMVQSLHSKGICVVLDVVYNHTSTTGDSNFDLTVPGYFYRFNEDGTYSNGSGCGNETASDREMMRRYMIESVKYWINEYHVDGFRFDLMGIHDIETMNQIRAAVDEIDKGIFIYGEGWSAGTCAIDADLLASKANAAQYPRIAAFGDEMRDAVRGPFNDDKIGAFLTGEKGCTESIKFGIVGAIQHPGINYASVNYSKEPWAIEPTQMISYASCHDDMCLGDRIKNTFKKSTLSQRMDAQKLAETIILTSQGVPFIYSGDEIIRDKKMVHNSFDSPDSVNTIIWENKALYNDVYKYVKDMVSLRKNHPALHMGSAENVQKNLSFLDVDNDNTVAFCIDGKAVGDSWGKIYVVFNGSSKKAAKVDVPKGNYVVVCKDGKIDPLGLTTVSSDKVKVSPTSALIMYSE